MSEQIQVFINEEPVPLARGTTVRDAVTDWNRDLGLALENGTAYVTDGVGRPIDLTTCVEPGSIFRVVESARRSRDSTRR